MKALREQYTPWLPVRGLGKEVDVETVVDGPDGLTVKLIYAEAKTRMTLNFEQTIAFRSIDESFRVRKWNEFLLEKQELSAMYKVKKSNWAKWLKEEAAGFLSERSIVHYCIFTSEDCLDIVTDIPPTITCEKVILSNAW